MKNSSALCKNHLQPWWIVKVSCGVLLITSIFDRFLFYKLNYWTGIPIPVSQILVIFGGSISIYHFYVLKNANQSIGQPNTLVIRGGLFPYVRHPMYFGDTVSYLGFFSFSINWTTTAILLISYIALFKQAQNEDDQLKKLFGDIFDSWSTQTKLLIPGIK